jgi:hypothetical protein
MNIFRNLFKKNQSNSELEPEPIVIDRQNVPVIFPDGHVEEYAPTFRIEDGINCIVCSGAEYHYHKHFDCKELLEEMAKDKTIKAFTVKDAEEHGKSYCPECSRMDLYLDIEIDDFDL